MDGFISYAHDDARLFRDFRTHLRAVERAFDIRFWADTSIHAGARWHDEIIRRVHSADVFILLISPDFLASDFIYDTELPAIQKREADAPDRVLVLPVILKPCYWQLVASQRQAVPLGDDGPRAIDEWCPKTTGHDRARHAIAEAIQSFYRLEPKRRMV